MKNLLALELILLLLVNCAGSLGPYVWNQNPDTNRFDALDAAEKNAVKKMTGIWTLSVVSENGERRKLLCVYDKQNSSFHFLTLQDPTTSWLPGELRYSFPYFPSMEPKEFIGTAFTQGYAAQLFGSRKDRSRRGISIKASVEPNQIIIKYLEDSDGGKNLDGTAIIQGSIQILKR